MQDYLRRSRLGGFLDGIGFHVLMLGLCLLWFFLLWGARLPSVSAGLALYGMAVLLRKKARDDLVARKEAQLRCTIGGEMALERLLLSQPERANFEIAMLLSLRHALTLLKTGAEGTLCLRGGRKWLISFLQLPATCAVGPERVLSLQRDMRALGADRGLLCVCGKISQEAREQAGNTVSFLPREKLVALLGSANPATDDQLVALGRRKKTPPPARWLPTVLNPVRARRYAVYGALLLAMYLLTHLLHYALPGLLCLALAAACRCVPGREEIFPRDEANEDILWESLKNIKNKP